MDPTAAFFIPVFPKEEYLAKGDASAALRAASIYYLAARTVWVTYVTKRVLQSMDIDASPHTDDYLRSAIASRAAVFPFMGDRLDWAAATNTDPTSNWTANSACYAMFVTRYVHYTKRNPDYTYTALHVCALGVPAGKMLTMRGAEAVPLKPAPVPKIRSSTRGDGFVARVFDNQIAESHNAWLVEDSRCNAETNLRHWSEVKAKLDTLFLFTPEMRRFVKDISPHPLHKLLSIRDLTIQDFEPALLEGLGFGEAEKLSAGLRSKLSEERDRMNVIDIKL